MNDNDENQGDNLGALALIKQVESEEKTENQPEPEQSTLPQETVEVGALEAGKAKARSLVKLLEKIFRMKEPRLEYGEETYKAAEDELGPLLAKHSLTEAGPMKYAEEANGVAFMANLAWGTIVGIRQMREEDERQQKQAEAAQHGSES